MPQRLRQLTEWLRNACELGEFRIEPASGDASFRRYFRATLPNGSCLIAMDAPPSREDCRPFVAVAEALEKVGLHVPHIHAQDLAHGFLLVEDLGDTQFLDVLTEASADRLYGDALGALVAMQACGSVAGLPPYDRGLLVDELELFRQWLCAKHLGLTLGNDDHRMLDDVFDVLVENALGQPAVFVHRDYHSRNLMVTRSPNPGILDFQDAVVGPVTYDLVSLLKDAYVRWPLARVEEWAWGYFQLAVQSGVLQPAHEHSFQRWFDLMGVQRHVKVAGIFARLFRRDGKSGYLRDIPLVLDYILEVAPRYAELGGLARLLEQRVTPKLTRAA
jgi:aminoglycoside/choline kinase family phosphotransferase